MYPTKIIKLKYICSYSNIDDYNLYINSTKQNGVKTISAIGLPNHTIKRTTQKLADIKYQ